MLQRKSCCVERLGLGAVAYGDVLVHALGLGDQHGRVSGRSYFLDGIGAGESRWCNAMDCIRPTVGRGRTDEYFAGHISAGVRVVAVVPPVENREAVFAGSGIASNFLYCSDRPVGGAELRSLRQVYFHPL